MKTDVMDQGMCSHSGYNYKNTNYYTQIILQIVHEVRMLTSNVAKIIPLFCLVLKVVEKNARSRLILFTQKS